MKSLTHSLSFIFFIIVGVSHAWALPDCVGSKNVYTWRNCQGTHTYADGSKWVGAWQNGKLNGYAITHYADGSINQEGIFKDDKFLYTEKRSKPVITPSTDSELDIHKEFCEEIGFTPKTEGFGNCVLELMKKD